MKLAIELSDGKGYGVTHEASCRDLRDPEPIGDALTWSEADDLVDAATSWERHHRYAPCVRLQH